MAKIFSLKSDQLEKLRTINPLLVSYNVEFAEVTGGTFWKAYSNSQITGEEAFDVEPSEEGIEAMYKDLMQVYKPINLYDDKLRYLAKALGQAWVRVSGTWSTKTYYDFDGSCNGQVPEGYLNLLTKEQWLGVLDFVKAIDGKLKISMANCPGLHSAKEPWHPKEAEKIFSMSKAYGVPIEAVEFANEPNMLEDTGFPEGYTATDYRRDQDLFFTWLDLHYPECLKVGPSTTGGDNVVFGKANQQGTGGIEQVARHLLNCSDLMEGTQVPLDVFSYHYYNGVSERLASIMPSAHWSAEEALSEDYLAVASDFCKTYLPLRDRYVPEAEMWVTESGDAGGGGNTWASTFLDVPRTLNELGTFARLTNGIVFHNTLATSDYGYLARDVFDPRPNYFAVLLWKRLMGNDVFDSTIAIQEGAHIFAHSRKDGQEGKAYLIINNSESSETLVNLPKEAELYLLEGEAKDKRARRMTLNGQLLQLSEDNQLPELLPQTVPAGQLSIPKTSCAFLIL
ncbi:beta-glucuronidase [Streptococcus iniae]|uniref:beta-glucuronidase n=1 Tax=Streptococcus iniae TaxID=1346 RepID=UPI002B2C0BD2|nr:beta-glucuronidase [Streptococcus iniae]WNZ90443.1 beta-glucuronidase [Streptococcus iniae]WNZ92084.1 beta-glucuronidase [Streptococcus iniae]WNZ93480.1 beta-glucuronidase [Streptococcus iniae]WNZ94706.1 beta-glucuronidase [Streptococcus iniae]